MQFQTYEYVLLFLPLVLVLYHLVRRNPVCANTVLYTASFLFYGFSGWYFLVFLIFSAFLDFFVGRRIYNTTDKSMKKNWLLVSIIANLSLLCVVKYSGWVVHESESLFRLMGFEGEWFHYTIPLVPGISFYTFQTLSYTIDIYKGEERPRNSLSSYLTFVSFFPQLIAGPIERSRDLLPQFEKARTVISSEVAASAFFLITWGIFKKLVFADNFGDMVDGANLREPGMGLIFGYAFAMQIYCDFSAYTDIARGSAKLFNVNLSTNFLTPYLAMDPREFWRRWHITLSTWIRDYIYIPLGGSRNGPSRTVINLMLTMFLCGLWHGAGVNFIVWGLYHGVLLVVYHRYPIHEKIIAHLGNVWGKGAAIFLFFNLGAVGWIFFRGQSAQDIGKAFHSIKELMIGNAGVEFLHAVYVFLLFFIPLMITEYVAWRRNTEYPELYARMPVWLKTAHYVVFFYALVLFGKRLSSEFIYFQF